VTVAFSNLDEPLFAGANASKRDLVTYLEAVAVQLLDDLRDRPLSVIRAVRGQPPFMQKNVPSYTPSWVRTVSLWAQASRREVSYALCDDLRALQWLANQRAVEYHPALVRVQQLDQPMYLVMDLDPASPDDFTAAAQAALLVRQALQELGLSAAVKTSGAKGVHVFVPLAHASFDDVASAARALAVRAERLDPALATTAFLKQDRGGKVFVDSTRVGGATVVSAYSPRIRPGVPVSFPVRWQDLLEIAPADFTIHTAPSLLGTRDPWREQMPAPQVLPAELIDEGRGLPIARVQAMHEGKRRARGSRTG
jgi:bifunctional non-homologous end joining protein LigD